MTIHSLFSLFISALLLSSSQTYAVCDLVLVNNEPYETPHKTYGNSGISLALQWIVLLDAQFQSREILPSVRKNTFFLKYLKDRHIDFESLEIDGKERWFGKYLLWVLNRMDRAVPSPQYTIDAWLKRLTGEEWSEQKITELSLSNKAHWQKLLAEKFPVTKEMKELKELPEKLPQDHLVYLIPTLPRGFYLYATEFKPPVASKQEHHRYGLARVGNPFWGQFNADHSSVIGVELHPLFLETKTLQPRASRFSESEIQREWSAQFGLIFPFGAAGSKHDVAQALELKGITKDSISKINDFPQFLGGSIRKLTYQLMKPQDFEAICNEYFARLKLRGELSGQETADEMNAKLKELYSLMGAKEFSLWVGPVIPSKHILHPQFYKDRFVIDKTR